MVKNFLRPAGQIAGRNRFIAPLGGKAAATRVLARLTAQ
jgi:hypothetical protein